MSLGISDLCPFVMSHCLYDIQLCTLNVYIECDSYICSAYVGMTFEVKIEADSNDITEHPHDGPSDVNFP